MHALTTGIAMSTNLAKKMQHFVEQSEAVGSERTSSGMALHALHFSLHEHGLPRIIGVSERGHNPVGRAALRPRGHFRVSQLLEYCKNSGEARTEAAAMRVQSGASCVGAIETASTAEVDRPGAWTEW